MKRERKTTSRNEEEKETKMMMRCEKMWERSRVEVCNSSLPLQHVSLFKHLSNTENGKKHLKNFSYSSEKNEENTKVKKK